MKKVNNFVKSNILTVYVGIMLLFFLLMLSACEKEPIEPFSPPEAINPTEIIGEWEITNFYLFNDIYKVNKSL